MRAAGRSGHRPAAEPRPLSSTDAEFTYPGAEAPVLREHHPHRPAGADHGDHRLHRRRQVDADLADPAARSTRPAAPSGWTGSTYATSTPTCCGAGSGWSRRSRSCSPARWPATCATATRTPTDDELWHALRVAQAEDFVRAMPGQLEAADRPGRHQRLRRAAAAALHRPGPGQAAGDLCVRRLVLRPRRHHRRPAPGRAQGRDPGPLRDHRRAAGGHDRRRGPDRGAGARRDRRRRHPRRAAARAAPPTSRSSNPS